MRRSPGIEAQATDVQRVTVWRVMARASLDRPMLGWGPGSAGSGYLATATMSEVEEAGRRWSDAHDLFLETAVTSGAFGLAALVWLVVLLTARSLRAGRDRAWAFGAAAGLAAYSVVEPIGLVLTPLLFLFAGIAAGPARVAEAERAGAAGVGTSSGRLGGRRDARRRHGRLAADARRGEPRAVGQGLRGDLGARGRASACSPGG